MRICIYQPGYFQPLHYFARIWSSDRFLSLNSAQINRKAGQTRARIKGKAGTTRLIVPVKGGNRVALNEAMPAYGERWARKHAQSISHTYQKAPMFKKVFPMLIDMYKSAENEKKTFSDMCETQIWRILKYLGWQGSMVSIDRKEEENASDWMLKLTKEFEGTEYVCGGVAYDSYLDLDSFLKEGVNVVVQDWICKEYAQQGNAPFIPNLSIIDGLMNCSKEELVDVLEGGD